MTEEELDRLIDKGDRIRADLEGLPGLGIGCAVVDASHDDNYTDIIIVRIEEIACHPEDEAWIGYDDYQGWYLGGLEGGEPEIYRSLDDDEFKCLLTTINRHLDDKIDIRDRVLTARRCRAEEQEWLNTQ
jgi:hypothetical protein